MSFLSLIRNTQLANKTSDVVRKVVEDCWRFSLRENILSIEKETTNSIASVRRHFDRMMKGMLSFRQMLYISFVQTSNHVAWINSTVDLVKLDWSNWWNEVRRRVRKSYTQLHSWQKGTDLLWLNTDRVYVRINYSISKRWGEGRPCKSSTRQTWLLFSHEEPKSPEILHNTKKRIQLVKIF